MSTISDGSYGAPEGIVTSTVLDEQKSFELLEEFRDRLSEIEIDKDDFVKFEETLKSGNR